MIIYHGHVFKRQSLIYENSSYSNDHQNNKSNRKSLPQREKSGKIYCETDLFLLFNFLVSVIVHG